jgi:2-deoxy-D-gluconate 3-dehydrogenase
MTELPKLPSFDLNGKTALVTGASSGIGLGCATALAGAGAHVVCAARGKERLEDVVAAMKAEGWSAEAVVLDQTDLTALKDVVVNATPDIVVNSAGLARHSSALETTPEDYDAVMDVNVRSAYFLSSYAAKEMVAAGKSGSIIHISSQMGLVGGVERAVYCASKFAIEGMVKAMAIEFAQNNIRFNTICPTFTRTPLTAPTFDDPEKIAWVMSKIKLDRVAEINDFMGAALYLASDLSAMVTGTHLLVDGGWTAD